MQLGGLGERCKLPRLVWAEPQPKSNLVRFNLKILTSGDNNFNKLNSHKNQLAKFLTLSDFRGGGKISRGKFLPQLYA